MMERCPECGKRHVVMWPELHPFRRGELFYCSHGCWEISLQRDLKIIKDIARKRRVKKVNGKLTVDQKARAVEIALAGESPLPYLKEIGMKNPSASWHYIKSVLKNTNPDRWAQLPERLPKNIETPETPITINAEDVGALVVDDSVVMIDKLKTMRETVSTSFTTKPNFSQTHSIPPKKQAKKYEVTGIRTDYGEFYYDRKFKSIDWRTDGGDEVGMDPKAWIELAEELPDILKALGVEE